MQLTSLRSRFVRYPHGVRIVGSLLQSSFPKEKEKKGENSHKACMICITYDLYIVCIYSILFIFSIVCIFIYL